MEPEFETALAQVAEDVFASMAFIFPRDVETPAEDETASRVVAEVAFSGPLEGNLAISVSESMLPTLAANMLGLEEGASASREQHQDALKELLNVICGNLLPRITTPRDVFDVHEPRIVQHAEPMEALQRSAPETKARLWLDCGRADLTLFVNYPSGVPVA